MIEGDNQMSLIDIGEIKENNGIWFVNIGSLSAEAIGKLMLHHIKKNIIDNNKNNAYN